ncbi:hypothetical protein PMAYCL1PPCAC_29665 [Pristionchus mayeri]|uniref:Phosphofructokinase domain-containing protein n=1 Tax=Pristionchus mayeri TaxID=1317129 RepID=A0AAN5DC77_9BILA|nr:hypothetical protein PMAYCL1PPCAC_29665 [Pristionchus mayeri]
MAGAGKKIAVLTSGGDAQGMNAALRAVVRLSHFHHAEIFYIKDGYKGLIAGSIERATWESVANVIQTGGTFIGSARSKEFMTKQGRLKAASVLALNEINALICIGGDGSLTGLQLLQSEWAQLMDELVDMDKMSVERAQRCMKLSVVGIVGSIDNDFASSDMTIGADSALTRIVEAIDAVVDTAQSHQRTFVIEVMGRQCGYLALTAALATEADFVFVPEWPAGVDWPSTMCNRLAMMRKLGRRLNVVIVAEGAMDDTGNKITPEAVQKVVEEKLKFDTRITKLGHVQRGGRASFLDRLLGTRMGAEAVYTVIEPSLCTEAYVIGMEGNKLKRVPLAKAIERNKMVATAFEKGDLNAVVRLRGKTFAEKVEYLQTTSEIAASRAVQSRSRSSSPCYSSSSSSSFSSFSPAVSPVTKIRSSPSIMNAKEENGEEMSEKSEKESNKSNRLGPSSNKPLELPAKKNMALAVLHVGAPAAGMNSITHSFVRCALAAGYDVYGVHDSLTGLASGVMEKLDWSSVAGWVSKGGSMLGTKKEKVTEPYAIAGTLSNYNIKGLLIVGGFEAYSASLYLSRQRKTLPELRIPMAVVPATISNNVPGTRVSIGSDTALNEIARLIDSVKQSGTGTRKRSFIVETMGGQCGYLAAMGGLAGAADSIHIFEEQMEGREVERQRVEAEHRVKRAGTHNYLMVRGEGCTMRSEEVLEIFRESHQMTSRLVTLGHVQQGGAPSVFDRQMGLRMGAKALSSLRTMLMEEPHPDSEKEGTVMIGLQGSSIRATPMIELKGISCFSHRSHNDTEWWRKLAILARVLALETRAPDSAKDKRGARALEALAEAVAEGQSEEKRESAGGEAKVSSLTPRGVLLPSFEQSVLQRGRGTRRTKGVEEESTMYSVSYEDELVEYEEGKTTKE